MDLRPQLERWRLGLKSQGGRGTCSVFAVTAALEYALAKKRNRGARLSEEFLNWASNRAIQDDQDGGFFHDLWTGYEKYGICLERYLPYAEKFDPALEPPRSARQSARAIRAHGLKWNWIKEWDVTTGLTDAQFAQIRETLQKGWPVCAGLRWPKQPVWNDGVLGMCPPEAVFDGHSVLLVGFADDPAQPGGGVFLFKNSADKGIYQSMPYVFAKTYANDAAWVDY